MKNQILEDPNEEKKGNIFSKLSFIFSVLALVGFSYIFSLLSNNIITAEGIKIPPLWSIYSTWFSCLFGFLFIIISIARKEKASFFKWASGILNLLYILLIIGTIIFPLVV